MRSLAGKIAAAVVALALVTALGWAGALAQDNALDPEVRAAAQAAAVEVAELVRPIGGLPGVPPVVSILTPEPTGEPTDDVTPEATGEATEEPTEEPTPTETPGPTDEPTDEPEPIETAEPGPTMDIGAVAQYTEEGVTILAPADWVVEPGVFGSLFDISAPGFDLIATVQSSAGEDFPGVVGVVLFRSFADALVSSLGEGITLVSVDSLLTDQLLPVTKIVFEGPVEGQDAVGVLYSMSPGADAYILVAYAPVDQWEAVEPGLDLIAQSVFFNESLITLVTAEGGDLFYEDIDGIYEIAVPEGWQVTDIDDDTFTVGIVDPDFSVVALLTAEEGLDDELAQLLTQLTAGVEPDQTQLDSILQGFAGAMGGDETYDIDYEQLQTFITVNGAVIRITGTMMMDETSAVDVTFYLGLQTDGMSGMMVIGTTEDVLAVEDTLVGVMESLIFLE